MPEPEVLTKDPEQLGFELLQLARTYIGDVLEVPAQVEMLRTLLAEQMLETGFLRLQLAELERQVQRHQDEIRRLRERSQ
jgi:hypothetical protein